MLAGRDELAHDYLRALEAELRQLEYPRPVETLYIGGGTPTHFDIQWLGKFLDLVEHWFPQASERLLAGDAERSVEANPNDITSEKLQMLADRGINRISLGVQSFNPRKLQLLERTHRADEAEHAIELSANVIGNVSIDLIFAAPGETPDDWLADLRRALALPIDHVSTYGLTIEKGTSFWSRVRSEDISEVGEADQLQMYRDAIELISDSRREHYEVSNFARPTRRCVHNLCYWQGKGWYAAGPGAARFIGDRREVNHRSPTTYIKRLLGGHSPVAESERVSDEQLLRERVAFGLRMIDGFDLPDAGPIAMVETLLAITLQHLADIKMIERHGNHIRLTQAGLMVSDSVLSAILSTAN